MSLISLQEHIENDDGYCTKCKAWTNFGSCEPDARQYECEECGHSTVYGAEEALLMGLVDGSEEEDD
jgi:hypothetical protein